MRSGVVLLLAGFFFPIVGLSAETAVQPGKKIVYEVRVYTWSFEKGVWYEDHVIKRITETYDAKGNLIEEDLADGKGVLLEKTRSAYKGENIKKTFADPDGKIVRLSVVIRSGKSEKETVTRPDGTILYQYVVIKDDEGRVTEKKQLDANNELVYRKSYVYDQKNNLAMINIHNPDGSLAVRITYRYKSFAPNGEWLSRSEYYSYGDVGFRPHEIVYRSVREEPQ